MTFGIRDAEEETRINVDQNKSICALANFFTVSKSETTYNSKKKPIHKIYDLNLRFKI